MLVLSRRIGETIKIGDNVEVQILDVNRGQVRIGIAAPKSTNIVRSELLGRPFNPEKAEESAPERDDRPQIIRRRLY